MSDKLYKEINEYSLEKVNMDKKIESVKKDFIKELKSGMGKDIKKIGSKPEKMKLSVMTKIKRFLIKYCQI